MNLQYRRSMICCTALVALSIILPGCAAFTGYPTNYQDTNAVIAADAPFLAADVRTKAQTAPNPQQYRDSVVYARIEVIDINYYNFESSLIGSYDTLSLGADLTTLALNGLGATTGSAATKAALAAASAGVIGANAAVNTDVFYKKTLPGLVSQMRASRQTALVDIKTGLARTVSAYSLDQALGDVSNYYVAGTLPSAVAQVTAKAGAELSVADARLASLRSVRFTAVASGSSTEQILAWLHPPDGKMSNPLNTANEQALIDWQNADTVDASLNGVPYLPWVRDSGPVSENDRQRAIIALKIPKVKK